MTPKPVRLLALTFYVASGWQSSGRLFSEQEVLALDEKYRNRKANDREVFKDVILELEENGISADEEIDVQLGANFVRRPLPDLNSLVSKRSEAIAQIVSETLQRQEAVIGRIVEQLSEWMLTKAIVRVVGAGRALLAASIAANRFAHGGAQVSIFGDKAPMPNTKLGGGVIAASASGTTGAVLEMMREAKARKLYIIGIAAEQADEFRQLCDCFLAVDFKPAKDVRLRSMADIQELTIAELLDALVVAAGVRIGIDFLHEDMGPKGPYVGPR